MPYATTSSITRQDGVLRTEFRAAVNIAAWRQGSIHDDQRARDLGFRGGLVSGLVHNEQYPPLALDAFGTRWFERGSYSLYYPQSTIDRELVRACIVDPGPVTAPAQVEAWTENEDGARVAHGTLSVDDVAEPSALRLRFENRRAPGDLRILQHVEPGTPMPERPTSWPLERQLPYRETITEPLDWYFGPSPWGGPIAASLALYRMLRHPGVQDFVNPGGGVQVDGGIEVRYVDGPVFLDTEYVLNGRVLAVGDTPRTEYLWFESELSEPGSGRIVAQKLMMCRWMKASSPYYKEDNEG